LAVISAAAILHYHRGPFLEGIDPDRQVTDHVFVDPHSPLEFRNRRRRGRNIQQHVVPFAVFPHAIGQVAQPPILALLDFTAIVDDELRECIGECINLRARYVLARDENVFVQRHPSQFPCG